MKPNKIKQNKEGRKEEEVGRKNEGKERKNGRNTYP